MLDRRNTSVTDTHIHSSNSITHQHALKTFSIPKWLKILWKLLNRTRKKVFEETSLQAVADGQVDGNSSQQYLELPRAIADEGGQGTKSTAWDFLKAWYTTITNHLYPLAGIQSVSYSVPCFGYTLPKKAAVQWVSMPWLCFKRYYFTTSREAPRRSI